VTDIYRADVDFSLSLGELSRCCGVSAEKIMVLIAEGVIDPCGDSEHAWRFVASDLIRAQSALRLERDLGVNAAGAALAIELIDEMRRMRERIRVLENLIS
jgi:chaperone modulatory protein CbpM